MIRATSRQKSSRREKQREEKARQKAISDKLAKSVEPGSWVRFRGHSYVRTIGKIGRVLDWDDDGYNSKRAPRNVRVKVVLEPHAQRGGEIFENVRAGYLEVISPLEVIAEASTGDNE